MREPESFWNQVEVKEKEEEERMRELLESGSKEKEKGEDALMDNGISVWWTKCNRKEKKGKKKEKGNVWMKERQRIRNHNLKILPQYFHNKF